MTPPLVKVVRPADFYGGKPIEESLRISMINSVAYTSEEVDTQQTEMLLDDTDLTRGRRTSYIIGKSAIVRFAERIYLAEGGRVCDLRPAVLKRAREIDIDLEAESEIIREVQEKRRHDIADRMAVNVFNKVMAGYPHDCRLEILERVSKEEGIPLGLLIEHVKSLHSVRQHAYLVWLDGIESELNQPEIETESAAEE